MTNKTCSFFQKNLIKTFPKLFALLFTITLLSCKKDDEENLKRTNKKIGNVITDTFSNATEDDVFKFEDLPQKEIHPLLAALILEEIDNAEEELRNPYYLDTITGNYRIRFDNEIDPFSVSFDAMKVVDLNNDNIKDYIIHRVSEGMLGGNMHSNSHFSYFIMKNDREYIQECQVLEYAPFSYNILDNGKLVGNKLKAEASKNFRTYSPDSYEEDVNGDGKIATKKLSFEYINGNLYEKSYLSDCELANLESKTIFNDYSEIAFRRRNIDMHNYTEIITEQYKFRDNEYINAELTGCDNLSLVFTYECPFKMFPGYNNKEKIKEKALEIVDLLIEKTQFEEEIGIIKDYYSNHSAINKDIKDSDGNEFSIDTQKEDKTIFIQISILINTNENQNENWEITTRKK